MGVVASKIDFYSAVARSVASSIVGVGSVVGFTFAAGSVGVAIVFNNICSAVAVSYKMC